VYANFVATASVAERQITDTVTAVNFDIRGFDTLGEEFILFVSVIGVIVLLRQQEHEHKEEEEDKRSPEEHAPAPSDATRALALAMIGPLVAFGIYIVSHGQLTPGGGFQGGVILATAPLLIYLAGDFETFKRITSHTLVEIAEAAGAAGFLAIGFAGLMLGENFLQNVFPLGQTGNVNSGGTIPLISLTTGLEVAAGFVLLLYAFLQQTLELRLRK
jgi:multicomponent Na+:H+ antiporter subunit B